ncbi:elastase-1-like [Liolophura sinensis]|uniref:elastase-1-like n=1 Tax=Liolophura sinensis TaxID=3198878 RepID=UPI0031596CB7
MAILTFRVLIAVTLLYSGQSAPRQSGWLDPTCERKHGICQPASSCTGKPVEYMPECTSPDICCVPNPYLSLDFEKPSPDDGRCGLITYQHDLMESLLPLGRQTRVVGGQPAAAWSWPWQAALRSRMYGHLCGGTLISSTWLLTAAHCVTRYLEDRSDVYVVLGDHYKSHMSGVEVYRGVRQIVSHRGYSRDGSMPHDIALLRLNSSVDIRGHHVRTACLPGPGDVFDSRDTCFITGWGQTEAAMESDVMKQLQVSITPQDVCRQNWAAVADIQPSQMCIGDGVTGACRDGPGRQWGAAGVPQKREVRTGGDHILGVL